MMPIKSLPRKVGYFEEYRCGCTSETEKRRRDLPGYCGKHGDSRRAVFWEILDPRDGKKCAVQQSGQSA